jgi:hypothetical protein
MRSVVIHRQAWARDPSHLIERARRRCAASDESNVASALALSETVASVEPLVAAYIAASVSLTAIVHRRCRRCEAARENQACAGERKASVDVRACHDPPPCPGAAMTSSGRLAPHWHMIGGFGAALCDGVHTGRRLFVKGIKAPARTGPIDARNGRHPTDWPCRSIHFGPGPRI